MTYGKASSFPEETLRRQQLLRGFFFRHRVPVNHPYWADLLGADVGPVIRRLPVTDADGGAAEENPLVMMTASSTGASFCIFFSIQFSFVLKMWMLFLVDKGEHKP